MLRFTILPAAALAGSLATVAVSAAVAATAEDLLAAYVSQAGRPGNASRGQTLFTSPHVSEFSCASCHGKVPLVEGKHARTGRNIAALAPAVSPERFSQAKRADKWFRRNCNDILGRECTPAEKADVLAWLISLKPPSRMATRAQP
jgi:mono/diheme cytochrome c family protein